MKLEVGMIVKFQDGRIEKINNISIEDRNAHFMMNFKRVYKDKILKASYDILDLIEEKDILLLFDKDYGIEYKEEVVRDYDGFKAVSNFEQDELLNLEYELESNEHITILEILTHEQFEEIAYRIEE